MQSLPVKSALENGFTLIELSIVLVIIGLIVSGILAGQDLIHAAEVRATITQIEKYNTAANTFHGKYGYLPGDINNAAATQFGFAARGQYAGQGDGNGLIEGIAVNSPNANNGLNIFGGETAMFWVDLSQAGLLDGHFGTASPLASPADVSLTQVANYFPTAALGRGNYIYVWSGGWLELQNASSSDGINYFGLSTVRSAVNGIPGSNTLLTVQQAYSIDKKMDDGLPQSGRVLAMYDGSNPWAAGGHTNGGGGQLNTGDFSLSTGGPVTSAGDIGMGTVAGPNSCYDGSTGLPEQYSLEVNSGTDANCALSFMFQ